MDQQNDSGRRDKVINLINSVIEKVGAAGEVSREHIYAELKDLHDIIEATRSEISATRANDISGKHIPTATDELDAVVEATEVATGTIMDSCDAVTEYAEQLDPAHKEFLVGEITKIFSKPALFRILRGNVLPKWLNH